MAGCRHPSPPMESLGPRVHLSLTSGFRDHYVRNNKGAGQKNVRCFPHCSDSGHNASSFCGAAVSVRVLLPLAAGAASPSAEQLAALYVYGQIVPSAGEPEAITARGGTVSVSEVANLCGNHAAEAGSFALPQLYKALPQGHERTREGLSLLFEFSRSSWHYNWKSNRNGPKVRSGGLWANGGR